VRTLHTIARNYDHPVVAEVLRKAKKIDPENNKRLYGPMAPGKKKRELESRWYDPVTDRYDSPGAVIGALCYIYPWQMLGIAVVLFGIPIGTVIIIRKIKRKRSRQTETGK